MKKYYIELWDENGFVYIAQSKWYDTKEQALAFAEQIEFCRVKISLMSTVWDYETGNYADIIQEEILK